MIYGIGTDIVRIARIEKNLLNYGDKLAQRILSEHEYLEYQKVNKPAHFLAKRFAAKEATAKAMGTGFVNGLKFSDISIDHDKRGKPVLVYYGLANDIIMSNEVKKSYISIADESDYAVAFVTLER